jgi:ribosomal protein S12 methylthiotransferase
MSEKTVHFISLGCPKNRVDSEVMLGGAELSGYQHVSDASEAEVIVVNTCGFIESAKRESIDTILEMVGHKQTGRCRKLVVTGCLSQRYSGDLEKELPEVDHFLGSSDMPSLKRVLTESAPRMLVGNPADWVISASDPRTLSTRGRSAYVKIAEGCNRSCSFCVIPQMRGKQRSRAVDDVVREVESLVSRGILEVNLISQDTIAYGRDLGGKANLATLLKELGKVKGLKWLRVFYLYPESFDDELFELYSGGHPSLLPYVDMPLQHAADEMLRRMRRGHGGKRLYALVERMREKIPGLTFRTAFIVGHPGESEEEFEDLVKFVEWAEFDRLGVFRYSDEEDTRAHEFESKVSARDSYQRARKILSIQRRISRRKNKQLVGRTLSVLVEGPSEESDLVLVGRHAGQAPEIDGVVFLSGGECQPGSFVDVQISQATDYDLLGNVLESDEIAGGLAFDAPPQLSRPLLVKASDGRRVLRTL